MGVIHRNIYQKSLVGTYKVFDKVNFRNIIRNFVTEEKNNSNPASTGPQGMFHRCNE